MEKKVLHCITFQKMKNKQTNKPKPKASQQKTSILRLHTKREELIKLNGKQYQEYSALTSADGYVNWHDHSGKLFQNSSPVSIK